MVPTGIRILWASSGLGILIIGTYSKGGGDSNPGGGRHTLVHSGSQSLLPSVWLHSWTWKPILHAWEGMKQQLQPLGTHRGAWSPLLVLGMLIASHPQAPTTWSPGHLPLQTKSNWSCTLRKPWQPHTFHGTIHQNVGSNPVDLWPGPGFSPSFSPRCLGSPWALLVARIHHHVVGRGWEQDPTNPLFSNWAAGSQKPTACLLAYHCSKQGTQATSWVVLPSPWHMPSPTPWTFCLGPALCGVWVGPSWLQAQQMGWHWTWVWLHWQL